MNEQTLIQSSGSHRLGFFIVMSGKVRESQPMVVQQDSKQHLPGHQVTALAVRDRYSPLITSLPNTYPTPVPAHASASVSVSGPTPSRTFTHLRWTAGWSDEAWTFCMEGSISRTRNVSVSWFLQRHDVAGVPDTVKLDVDVGIWGPLEIVGERRFVEEDAAHITNLRACTGLLAVCCSDCGSRL